MKQFPMRGILDNTIKSFITFRKLMKLTTFLRVRKVVFFCLYMKRGAYISVLYRSVVNLV